MRPLVCRANLKSSTTLGSADLYLRGVPLAYEGAFASNFMSGLQALD